MKQGFAWWSVVEGREPVKDLLEQAAAIGYNGVDFLPEEHWKRAQECGLNVVVIGGHESMEVGFNDPRNHRDLSRQVREAIAKAASAEIPFVTVTAGNRVDGDADTIKACVSGLEPLVDEAEAAGTVLVVEPVNSKLDHPGHECTSVAWAAELIEHVESPSLRMLYDFYHAQLMEGDLLRTVDSHWDRIVHLHTAGVPGRHEPGPDQEINYAYIAEWLQRRRYAGCVTHEYLPRGDVIDSLRKTFEAFAIASGGHDDRRGCR